MIVKIIFDDLTTYFDIESWKTAVSSELKTCLSFKIKAHIPAFNFQDLESNSSFKKSRHNLTVGRIFQIFFWGQKALISLRKRYFIKAKKSISARRSKHEKEQTMQYNKKNGQAAVDHLSSVIRIILTDLQASGNSITKRHHHHQDKSKYYCMQAIV